MPIVVNSNTTATIASFNLSHANDSLRKSLARLSSGKRIVSPADDAGGMAVAYKLNSKLIRTEAVRQNVQNGISYLQVQDGALSTMAEIVSRMSELRTMANDVTKNTQDIENYSKEFIELQSQLNQVKQEKFNGISLFSSQGSTAAGTLIQQTGVQVTTAGGQVVTYEKYGRTLITHPSGVDTMGSISINVVNLQFVLSIGTLARSGTTNVDLGGLDTTAGTGGINADGFITSILDVNVSQFTEAIERLADMRAENGAEQNRVMNTIDLLQTNITNLEAAHGRIMDADIALESTRFARHNVLVQASAAMTAQANQLTNVALQLLG